MRKRINQTGFIIAGVAALFVGLASNMQAVPISMHNNWEAGMRSWVLGPDILGQNLQGKEIAHYVVGQVNQKQMSASPNASLSTPVSAQIAGVHGNSGSSGSNNGSQGGSQGAPSPTILPIAHGPASISVPYVSVPDGGTTAMMMAGTFCGLALLRKTLKV